MIIKNESDSLERIIFTCDCGAGYGYWSERLIEVDTYSKKGFIKLSWLAKGEIEQPKEEHLLIETIPGHFIKSGEK